MNVVIDTCFLICLAVKEHPKHESARAKMAELEGSKVQWQLSSVIITEFLHVVSDRRRFEHAPSVQEGIQFVRFWLKKANTSFLSMNQSTVEILIEQLDKHQLGRKRVLDTNLASLALAHKINKVITLNQKDFKVFPEIEVIDF